MTNALEKLGITPEDFAAAMGTPLPTASIGIDGKLVISFDPMAYLQETAGSHLELCSQPDRFLKTASSLSFAIKGNDVYNAFKDKGYMRENRWHFPSDSNYTVRLSPACVMAVQIPREAPTGSRALATTDFPNHFDDNIVPRVIQLRLDPTVAKQVIPAVATLRREEAAKTTSEAAQQERQVRDEVRAALSDKNTIKNVAILSAFVQQTLLDNGKASQEGSTGLKVRLDHSGSFGQEGTASVPPEISISWPITRPIDNHVIYEEIRQIVPAGIQASFGGARQGMGDARLYASPQTLVAELKAKIPAAYAAAIQSVASQQVQK